jgi:hypothetical protein
MAEMKQGGELTRTPMPPRAEPMSRGNGFQRQPVAEHGAVAGKRAAQEETGFSPATRLLCRTRAGNGDIADCACEACGRHLGEYGGEIQHRNARRMGGSKLRNNIANGAALCADRDGPNPLRDDGRSCHRRCEDRDEDMHAEGWWLEYGENPLEVPVMLHGRDGGITVRLDDLGGYQDDDPQAGAA